MELLQSAKSIIRTNYPKEILRQQSASIWRGGYQLPEELKKYYVDLGPVNLEIGAKDHGFYFPCLFELSQFQASHDVQPSHRAVALDSDDHWIAIGDDGNRAFFLSLRHGVVCYEDASKSAQEQILFPDLGCLMQVVSLMSEVIAESKAPFLDIATGEINTNCKEQAFFKLIDFTGSMQISRNVLKAFGWY